MSNTIQIKRSTTAAAVPTAGQLAVGELAVNLVDKKLYTKDALGAVVSLTPDAPVISDKIQPVTASVASNALTVTLNPTTLDFRSATLGSGTVNTRTIATAISAVVPSGATLGTTNAVLSTVILIAIDNAGTIELAVCNGSLSLDESALISTTALSADADSATVVYSTTARTNVPFRIVGFVESTQSTAGTWASAPSKIQGYGGLAFQPVVRGITSATSVTASGTSVDFTGIPSWAKRVTVMFSAVSTNGTAFQRVQIGSGTFLTSGYTGAASAISSTTGDSAAAISTGFDIRHAASAATSTNGVMLLVNITGNTWAASGVLSSTSDSRTMQTAGVATLVGTLDRVRITTTNGTNTFDAGTINIMYEG